MKKASLIVCIIEIILTPFYGLFLFNMYKDLVVTNIPYEERPDFNLLFKFFIISMILGTIISIGLLVLARILIAKKRKIPAVILTVIFVSKIGGLLTFFIKYGDEPKPVVQENILGPAPEEETNEVRARNKCPYCGKVVSKFDESCPYCGHKLF